MNNWAKASVLIRPNLPDLKVGVSECFSRKPILIRLYTSIRQLADGVSEKEKFNCTTKSFRRAGKTVHNHILLSSTHDFDKVIPSGKSWVISKS